jgi:Protein of unknown function (DUF3987)
MIDLNRAPKQTRDERARGGDRYVPTPVARQAVEGRETEILDSLPIVWRNGKLHVQCPFADHPDRHPSWRWDEREQRYHCTCGSGDIFDVIGQLEGADFDRSKVRAAEILHRDDIIVDPVARQAKPKKPFNIVAVYRYDDENGYALFEVCRTDTKEFPQRRPDGAWGIEGVRRVPYRLPGLIAAKGGRVFIMEGEKDCDLATNLRLVATTNPEGAGKWRPEFAQYFEADDAVIIADNDDVGRDHAKQVAASLAPVAARVRILNLPGVPEKGDFSDWFGAGRTLNEFEALVAEAQPWIAPPKTSERGPDSAYNPWPEPLSDAAYHGIAGEFVSTILPHTEADPAALLFQFLTFAGNVFGDTAWVTVERTKHYANLFIVVVGATAKSRKGTAEGWVRDLLRIAASAWDRNCIASGLSTGEGLIARVRDPEYGKDKKGMTELIHPGVADKRLLIVESEFSRPLHVMERGGNSTLSAVLRDAWDHKPLSILTRNDPVKAHGASISIVAHITCEELRRDLTDISTANGFANRFLWTVAQRSKALPFGGNVSEGVFEELANRLRASLEQPSVGPIRFDEIARHKWHNVYPDLTEDRPGLLGAITARTEAQVVRVAIIYALLDRQNLIGKAHLAAALEVVRYSNDSVRHIFGDTTGNHIADTILKALRGNSEGLSRWDISNLFSGNTKSAVIIDALSQLLAAGKIRSQRVSTGGRPAEMWFPA